MTVVFKLLSLGKVIKQEWQKSPEDRFDLQEPMKLDNIWCHYLYLYFFFLLFLFKLFKFNFEAPNGCFVVY